MRAFNRYIGIDYSGAATSLTPLTGLRVYMTRPEARCLQVRLDRGRLWTRQTLAFWLVERLVEDEPTLVGMDLSFSFPMAYFEAHDVPLQWPDFLDDFQRHWPTDDSDVSVEQVRRGARGLGAQRTGNSRWRRLVDRRTSAKSAFHFDVPGSVAKSTHAGLSWLRFVRQSLRDRVHFWPFDGWTPSPGRSVVAEVYPSMWNKSYRLAGRSADERDAYAVAMWLRHADENGALAHYFMPELTDAQRALAQVEGWILGVH